MVSFPQPFFPPLAFIYKNPYDTFLWVWLISLKILVSSYSLWGTYKKIGVKLDFLWEMYERYYSEHDRFILSYT